MSALTPHIRVLRALAEKLDEQSNKSFECTSDGAHDEDLHPMLEQNGSLLGRFSAACSDAADQLEAEEAALQPPHEGTDKTITYNPRGKH